MCGFRIGCLSATIVPWNSMLGPFGREKIVLYRNKNGKTFIFLFNGVTIIVLYASDRIIISSGWRVFDNREEEAKMMNIWRSENRDKNGKIFHFLFFFFFYKTITIVLYVFDRFISNCRKSIDLYKYDRIVNV